MNAAPKPHYVYRAGRWQLPEPSELQKRVKRQLQATGVSFSQWCREHRVSRHTVNDLLRGKQRGHYGAAHRAAVLLGLKPGTPGSAA